MSRVALAWRAGGRLRVRRPAGASKATRPRVRFRREDRQARHDLVNGSAALRGGEADRIDRRSPTPSDGLMRVGLHFVHQFGSHLDRRGFDVGQFWARL